MLSNKFLIFRIFNIEAHECINSNKLKEMKEVFCSIECNVPLKRILVHVLTKLPYKEIT